jgi:hypothetical protein
LIVYGVIRRNCDSLGDKIIFFPKKKKRKN